VKLASFAGTVVFAGTLSLAVAAPVAARSQAQTPCSLVSAADMTLVLGAGAKATPVGDEQCTIEGTAGEYEIHVKRENVADEMKSWQQFTMVKPVTAVKDIGDEVYTDKTGTAIIARKGSVAIRVSSAVTPKAPMPYKEAVVELAKRVVAKLK